MRPFVARYRLLMSPWQARPLARLLVVAGLVVSPVVSGCFLKPKQKSDKRAARSAPQLIVRDSIYMDRIGDRDTARLQFKTNRAAACELAYYSQEPGGTPTKEAPKVVPCSSPEKLRTEFTERLEGLSAETVYFVVITAWEKSRAQSDSVIVRETAGTTGTPPGSPGTSPKPGGGGGGGGGEEEASYKELFVARLDLPLRVAEFHRHVLAKPTSLSELKSQLTSPEGCQLGVPKPNRPFREATSEVGLENLATRDLAAGSATPHRDHPQRLALQYPSLNQGLDKWSLLYQVAGRDLIVPARPIAQFATVEMTSATSALFETPPNLAEAADPLKLDLTKPLKISWSSGNQLTSLSYVTVQIGRSNQAKAIYCIFPAEKRTGTIAPNLLAELESGRHVISVELSSNLVLAKDAWLVSAHDWRSGRIEK